MLTDAQVDALLSYVKLDTRLVSLWHCRGMDFEFPGNELCELGDTDSNGTAQWAQDDPTATAAM